MKITFRVLLLAALIVGAAGGIAFGGGVLYGRNSAPKSTSLSTAAGGASAAARTTPTAGGATGAPTGGANRGPGAANGAGGGGGGGTAGAVDSISGNTLTVRTQQGTLQTVNLTPQTRILMTTTDSVADLKPGTPIQVLGQPDSSGSINATAVTLQQTTSPLQPIGQPGSSATPTAQRGGAGPAGGQGRPAGAPAQATP